MGDTNFRVLVIDDNPKNLDVLAELLDEQDFVVLFALDGKNGIQRAESGQPDLILLDIMMPGIDGFETCRQLKAKECTQKIPIIFMTALSETADKIRGFELGAVDYITKPIQPEEVLARVNTHLRIQQLQQTLYTKNIELQASLEREKELNSIKSRFISIASHEFRTPLAAIQMTIDALRRYGKRMSDEKKDSAYERVRNSIQRMNTMLNDVLMLLKVEAEMYDFSPKLIDLNKFCRHVMHEFQVMSENSHDMTFSAPEQLLEIQIDRKLFHHILSNVLSNAIKYSPVGSSIQIELLQEKKHVKLSIKDAGIGIEKKDQIHLFDAFHRGGNVGNIQGTGLGLSIAKQFLDLHHGTIEIQSELNRGSTFIITLPRSAEPNFLPR